MYKINLNKISKKYLKSLGFKKNYKFNFRSCEVCNSKNNKIIQKKISIVNEKFLDFPIVVLLNVHLKYVGHSFQLNLYMSHKYLLRISVGCRFDWMLHQALKLKMALEHFLPMEYA